MQTTAIQAIQQETAAIQPAQVITPPVAAMLLQEPDVKTRHVTAQEITHPRITEEEIISETWTMPIINQYSLFKKSL